MLNWGAYHLSELARQVGKCAHITYQFSQTERGGYDQIGLHSTAGSVLLEPVLSLADLMCNIHALTNSIGQF